MVVVFAGCWGSALGAGSSAMPTIYVPNPDDDGASFKFSCRSCNRKDGAIVHHTYTKNEIDYFVTHYQGKSYLIPVEECGGDKRLRLQPTKNGQVRGITWAKDYELEEVVKHM